MKGYSVYFQQLPLYGAVRVMGSSVTPPLTAQPVVAAVTRDAAHRAAGVAGPDVAERSAEWAAAEGRLGLEVAVALQVEARDVAENQ
jgi:hypothetical protein